jgi:hypothetical protein
MSGIFLNDWADGDEKSVLSDFGMPPEALDGAEVIVASYTYEVYEGSAYVLFRRDGKFFEVHGSHCSCYGLSEVGIMGEGPSQWQPEETTVEAIMHQAEKGWFDTGVKEALALALK